MLIELARSFYQEYLVERNGKNYIYIKLKKEIYGLLCSALLFYIKLSIDLVNQGFSLNPYDPCVANKIINGLQMTIIWHIDDLKILHVSDGELDKFLCHIKKEYADEQIGQVKTTRGSVHKYFGMELYFGTTGQVQVSMKDYVSRMLLDFPETINKTNSTPEAAHFFKVRSAEEVLPLSEE